MKKQKKKPSFIRIFINYLLPIFAIVGTIYWSYSPLMTLPEGLRKDELLMYWTYGNEVVRNNFLNFHQLGLWDNISATGYPLIGHISTQFYPLTLLFYFIPSIQFASQFTFMLHLMLGGVACFYLLKTLKCNSVSSMLGSITFTTNTYITTVLLSGYPSEIYNLVWTPLAVALFIQGIEKNKKIYSMMSGVCIAMNILAMMLYAVYFNVFIILAVIVFFLIYGLLKRENNRKKILIHSLVVFSVAVGLSAIKLLPVLEYTKYSIRQSLPLYGGLEGVSGSWNMATLPDLGKHFLGMLIPYSSFSNKYNLTIYLFVLLIIIAAFRRNWRNALFACVTIFFCLAATGRNFVVDLYLPFYYLFPPIQSQYALLRFFIITNLSMSIMASQGLMHIYSSIYGRHKFVASFVIVLIIFIIVFPLATFTRNQMQHLYNEQFYINKAYLNNEVNKEIVNLKSKQNEIIHFASANTYVYGYSALVNRYRLTNPMHRDFSISYEDFIFYYEKLPNDQIYKKYKLLGLLNAKYIVTQKDRDDYPNKFISPVETNAKWGIYQIKDYSQYARIPTYSILLIGKNNSDVQKAFKAKMLVLNDSISAKKFSIVTTDKERINDFEDNELMSFDGIIQYDTPQELTFREKKLIDKFKRKGGKMLNVVFYERYFDDIRFRDISLFSNNPAEILSPNSQRAFSSFIYSFPAKNKRVKISFTKNSPERMHFEVTTSGTNNFLVIASTFFPGWEAYVDGEKTYIYMADGMNKGIQIEGSGKHSVVFVYKSKMFLYGATISIFTVCIVLFCIALKIRRKKLH